MLQGHILVVTARHFMLQGHILVVTGGHFMLQGHILVVTGGHLAQQGWYSSNYRARLLALRGRIVAPFSAMIVSPALHTYLLLS